LARVRAFLAQHCIFRQHAVEIGAEPVGQVVGLDRSAKPARVKAAGNPVANFDPRNAFADCCDLTGPIGQRHHTDLRWAAPAAFENHQIAVVERARTHLHQGRIELAPRLSGRIAER